MAELKLGEHQAAEADSTQAIALDPSYVKVRNKQQASQLLMYAQQGILQPA